MARIVRHFVEEARPCAYLGDQKASLEYRLMVNVTPDELEALLLRGWRRFGPAYFRPACRPCGECVSIRLDIGKFEASPSQKRAQRRSKRFRIELGKPGVDQTRLELHAAWHSTRELSRGWDPSTLTEEEYATQFSFPSSTGREMSWYDGDRLVAVSLLDITPHCVSAAYFFYHPDIARLSPGVGNVLRCAQLSKELGAQHLYLGYQVKECLSLQYKGYFKPHELLEGRPAMFEPPSWREVK